MRILYLAAGAGNFHCGTCIRDTALVRGLRSVGHEVEVLSLYLPLFPEEADMGKENPIFFGGVNVFLQQKAGFFRAMPMWADSFLSSRALLRTVGKRASSTAPSSLGPMTISMLKGEAGRQKKEVRRLLRWMDKQQSFDLVCLSNSLLGGLAKPIKDATGAKVVASLQGEEGFLDALPEPHREEAWRWMRESCAELDALIAVSRDYGDRMRDRLSCKKEKLHVVWNGIETAGYAHETSRVVRAENPVLGYLARMCPEKGLGDLVEAFLQLHRQGFTPKARLSVVGACTQADRPFVESLKKKIEEAGLGDEVSWHASVSHEEKQVLLRAMDVFCVPGPHDESFGLYVIEAMASGLPVVAPAHASFPEIIHKTRGGTLYDPERPDGLLGALKEMLALPEEAHVFGKRGQAAVHESFSSSEMSSSFAEVLEGLLMDSPEDVLAV